MMHSYPLYLVLGSYSKMEIDRYLRVSGTKAPQLRPRPPTLPALSSYNYLCGPYGYDYYRGYDSLPSDMTLSSLSRHKRSSALSDKHSSTDRLDEDDDKNRKIVAQSKKKKKRKYPITANLSGTRYDVVRQMCDRLGYTISRDEDQSSYLYWNDSFVSSERISELKPYQRINHFPGMGEICRKDCLARNMLKMAKTHPEEYSFVPRTWILPSEYSALQNYARELKKKKKTRTFIVKPSNGAMGNGISLVRNAEKIAPTDHTIVQEYIDKPLVVEGYKCDLRIYVLVSSADPLRIFLYNDGLLRMGTEQYIPPTDTNIEHLYMHLTNYSVNKHSNDYEKSSHADTGSKRSLKFLNEYLRKKDYDVAYMWKNITDIIVKTLVVAHPHVLLAYRMCRPGQAPGSDSVCFEILGFDIMLDRKLRPWLLEINRSPSFGTDEKLDYDVKSGVMLDTLKLLNMKGSDKRKNMAAQKLQAQRRLMRPTKRVDSEISETQKKQQSLERRKDELKDMLIRLRKDSAREDFEDRNCGRFKRIFPPDDKFRREKYANLMADAFGVFLSGRANTLQQEIHRTYSSRLKEEDILDMIAQVEADELPRTSGFNPRPIRGPKPLCSMPVLEPQRLRDDLVDDDDEDEEEELDDSQDESTTGRLSPPTRPPSRGAGSRPNSAVYTRSSSGTRPLSGSVTSSARTKSRASSAAQQLWPFQRPSSAMGDAYLLEEALSASNERTREEKLTDRSLLFLTDMRIKFPGKTDEEAEYILHKLYENWSFHKPRIASYWLAKLDSIKRRKVIDIVRSNVRAVLQRTWKCADIESLSIYRLFSRVFNRLLWSNGQGLWSCFQATGDPDDSWEVIFTKCTENVRTSEMSCCRRIVQLCRDCLLIVYQFAAEAKGSSFTNLAAAHPPPPSEGDRHPRPPSIGAKAAGSQHSKPSPNQLLSRTVYQQSRSFSMNSLQPQPQPGPS